VKIAWLAFLLPSNAVRECSSNGPFQKQTFTCILTYIHTYTHRRDPTNWAAKHKKYKSTKGKET
jgi:hypothetical protein